MAHTLKFDCDGDIWENDCVTTSLTRIIHGYYHHTNQFDTIVIDNQSLIDYNLVLDYPKVNNIVLRSTSGWLFNIYKQYDDQYLWANRNINMFNLNNSYQLFNVHGLGKCKVIHFLNNT